MVPVRSLSDATLFLARLEGHGIRPQLQRASAQWVARHVELQQDAPAAAPAASAASNAPARGTDDVSRDALRPAGEGCGTDIGRDDVAEGDILVVEGTLAPLAGSGNLCRA